MYFFESTCQIQITAQAAGDLLHISPDIQGDTKQVMATGTSGTGGQIAWPALLRKLDKIDPGFRNQASDHASQHSTP